MAPDKPDKLEEILKKKTPEKIEEKESNEEGAKKVAEGLEREAEVLLQKNEEAGAMLSSPDIAEVITEVERKEFEAELLSIKAETVSLMQSMRDRFAEFAGKSAEILGRIGGDLKSFGKDVSEIIVSKIEQRRRGAKGIDLILANIPFENEKVLKKEWEEKKSEKHFFVSETHFPLNDKGLKIVKALMKKEPTTLYEVEDLMRNASEISDVMKEGISLETLQRIDRSYNRLKSIYERPEDIEKLKALDKMDFKETTDKILNLTDLQYISLDKMKLFSQNPYVTFKWKDSGYFTLDKLANILTEDNLAKLKEFDSNVSAIPVSEFIAFVTQISDLPPEIQEMCKTEYGKGKKMRDITYNTHEVFRGLDDRGVARLKALIANGVITFDYAPNLEKYLSLDDHIFDRCASIGEDMKKTSIDHLLELNTMSDEEFDLFKSIRDEGNIGYIGHNIDAFKEINSKLGVVGGNLLMKWMVKSDQLQNFKYYTQEQYLEEFKKLAEVIKSEPDIDLLDLVSKAYGSVKVKEALSEYDPDGKGNAVSWTASRLKESPESIIPDILSRTEGLENTFINFQDVQKMLEQKDIYFTGEDKVSLFSNLLSKKPTVLLESNTFPLTEEQRKLALENLIDGSPIEVIAKYSIFENEYLKYGDNKQDYLNKLFDNLVRVKPLALLDSKDFPFTDEQKQYLEIFRRIQDSPSRELKNMATEIAPLVAQYKSSDEANEALKKIEQIFLTNNIPLVGKQYKVFEILYPNESLSKSVGRGRIESLKILHNSSEQRLVIFKDLMRAHVASADSNLEQYLLILKDGKDVLAEFEDGAILNDAEKSTLKLFIKKINTLSGHSGRKSIGVSADMSDEEMTDEIDKLGEAFGVREGESIIQKFERTFLKRIGIDSIEDALVAMEEYRNEATLRNERGAETGTIELKEGDLYKSISSDYLDSYLDRGIYAPEFVGAESNGSVSKSKNSDWTPLDTDFFRLDEDKKMSEVSPESYGDIMIVVKQKDQFQKDGLDVFKTGVINDNHYGIRTGFGSTEIDLITVATYANNDKKIDQLKYFIAKKGFYIPICNTSGEVIFTKEEFDQQRKIFSGIKRFHGDDMDVSDSWKSSERASLIQGVAQTAENIESITKVRDTVMNRIQNILAKEGIALHQGKYDESLKGAVIADTGSTGRGSSLDEKLDFDFAIKLDDTEWDKVSSLIKKLSDVFPIADQYENRGMMMFRSNEVEIDGFKMTIDVGFNRKSDSEEFDAHDALKEKYDSIEKKYGEQAYLDTLSNIRFAKNKLKEAECYKKGVGGEGQQGGLGGIGVEYWILQNGGDSVEAFRSFEQYAFKDGNLVTFEEFKKTYKVFSAGQNIRGSVKVENFTDNMTNEGYIKMAQLAKEISG